jgi:thymidylate synthase (FAD)
MHAIYENHYLTDRDVANFARQSFATLADNFTESQNNNLVRFLARGMANGDWEKLIEQLLDLGKTDYASLPGSSAEAANRSKAKKLATYMRKIPEHWVPFGHPQISLRMSAPIPIRVQCFKHKVGFVESEESRRYISTTPQFFIPNHFRAAAESVKQGSGDIHKDSDFWKQMYSWACTDAIQKYEDMIKAEVCPEQARFILPQGCEVNWLWTGSLYAFANFFNQRSDSHAQKEVQDLAKLVGDIIEPLYPVSWSALTQGNY